VVEFPGNILQSPGYSKTGFSQDDEILASMKGFTQKGVTLKAGQGVLTLGTVLGQATADKKWRPYADANTDGTQTARGILRQTVDTGTNASGPDFQGNIVIAGILKNSKIKSSGAGAVDAAAIADLNARVDTVLDLFTF
jgi:hypothetical protein